MSSLTAKLGWLAFALVGAFAFALIALNHGESIGAIWIVVATVCVYTIAYRFYSKFIAAKVRSQRRPPRLVQSRRVRLGCATRC